MKYLFCEATKLDNLQMMEPLATILHSYIVPAKAIKHTFSFQKTHIYQWLNVYLGSFNFSYNFTFTYSSILI